MRRGARTFLAVGAALVLVVVSGALAWSLTAPSTAQSAPRTPLAKVVAPVPERPEPQWKVLASSARGVMTDFRNIVVGGVVFRALRLRARTTLLRWHVGAGDPNAWRRAPQDAGPSIDWANEGPAGVVAVFNGAFKQAARAGGASVDHVVLEPMVRGDMTLALSNEGHWEMGIWGQRGFPTPGFHVIALRQNLAPLVEKGRLTRAALSANWHAWGDPINENPLTARSGIGIDAQGNLIYVATMTGVLAPTLGRALIAAGALTAMQLDINPYWPILGAAAAPLHRPGNYVMTLPGAQHSPLIYDTGWERDFFVALAEPASWSCQWSSPGVRATPGPQPQMLRERGSHCATTTSTTTSSTTTSSSPSTTSTTAMGTTATTTSP